MGTATGGGYGSAPSGRGGGTSGGGGGYGGFGSVGYAGVGSGAEGYYDEQTAAMDEEGRLAGVRRRSALRKPIRQVAESYGMDLSREQLEAAAGQVDWGQQTQGMMQGDAIAAVLQDIINNQMMMAEQGNQGFGQIQQLRQQARRVPSLLQWGAGQDRAQGDAADPWAAINPIAAQVDLLTERMGRMQRQQSRRPSILDIGMF
ncbi:MAG: hypothetical protein BGO49_25210 [Planctomycetales bacterium 71-10]|nr:MAG: hypothetical protein BGO49_25210 [Planctomycetales bacterium 71-10]